MSTFDCTVGTKALMGYQEGGGYL